MSERTLWKGLAAGGLTAIVLGMSSQADAQDNFFGKPQEPDTTKKEQYWTKEGLDGFVKSTSSRWSENSYFHKTEKVEKKEERDPNKRFSTETSNSDRQMQKEYAKERKFGGVELEFQKDDSTGTSTTTTTRKHTKYKELEVYEESYFPNAKLIGMDKSEIYFRMPENSNASISIKGLLFELEGGETIELIAPLDHYYTGQRYNITYHEFIPGKHPTGREAANIIGSRTAYHVMTTGCDLEFDGVLKESQRCERR